jgi:hypothetical protein
VASRTTTNRAWIIMLFFRVEAMDWRSVVTALAVVGDGPPHWSRRSRSEPMGSFWTPSPAVVERGGLTKTRGGLPIIPRSCAQGDRSSGTPTEGTKNHAAHLDRRRPACFPSRVHELEECMEVYESLVAKVGHKLTAEWGSV